MFVNRLGASRRPMNYNEKSSTIPRAGAAPIAVPRRSEPLVELFEPSSPTRPHRNARRRSWVADQLVSGCTDCGKRFGLFMRRHHCRSCGRIFCDGCSNNRLTQLHSIDDKNYYRLCNACIDGLLETEQAVPVNTDRCGIGFALQFRKVAAVSPNEHHHHWSQSSSPGSVIDEGNLMQFDEELAMGPAPSRMSAPAPLPFAPILSPDSTPTSEGFFTRIASMALSLPARLRSTTSARAAEAHYADTTLDICPVCSMSFRKWDSERMQAHVEECIKRAEHSGSVLGDRYSVHRWSRSTVERECTICYEEFLTGQPVAVLNCLCQYHEKCIDAWFERGKYCPYHYQL